MEINKYPGSPRRNESQQRHNSDENHKRMMETLWHRMAEMYGAAWSTPYGDEPNDSWARALSSLTQQDFARGIEAVIAAGNTFPPNAPEFAKMCKALSASPNGQNAAAYLEYSKTQSRPASAKTASAYLSVMRHCMGADAPIPGAVNTTESMPLEQAAPYVRAHMAKTTRKYCPQFSAQYNKELDEHYQESCHGVEDMMRGAGL